MFGTRAAGDEILRRDGRLLAGPVGVGHDGADERGPVVSPALVIEVAIKERVERSGRELPEVGSGEAEVIPPYRLELRPVGRLA